MSDIHINVYIYSFVMFMYKQINSIYTNTLDSPDAELLAAVAHSYSHVYIRVIAPL